MIARAKHETGFTIVDNGFLRDDNLSMKAKGTLAYILSKPDDWRFSAERIARECSDGPRAIRAALRELEAAGYASFRKDRGSGGRIVSRWTFSETSANKPPSRAHGESVNRKTVERDSKEVLPTKDCHVASTPSVQNRDTVAQALDVVADRITNRRSDLTNPRGFRATTRRNLETERRGEADALVAAHPDWHVVDLVAALDPVGAGSTSVEPACSLCHDGGRLGTELVDGIDEAVVIWCTCEAGQRMEAAA